MRRASIAVALVLGACAAPCDDALPATVTLAESGERWTVIGIDTARPLLGQRASVLVRTELGYTLHLDLAMPPPRDRPLGFVADGTGLPPVRVDLIRDLELLCETEGRAAEGDLVVRSIAWDESGFVTCLDATLTVRFASCEHTLPDLRAVAEQTFVVELGHP